MTATLTDGRQVNKFLVAPWDGGDKGVVPFEKRSWVANAKTGTLNPIDERWLLEDLPEGGRELVNHGRTTVMKRYMPELDFTQAVRVYKLSATKKVSILDAVIDVLGEKNLAPAWLDEARDEGVPVYMADPRYAEEDLPSSLPKPRRLGKVKAS